MTVKEILDFRPDFAEYLRDESRKTGTAQSISFPETEEEVRAILRAVCGRKLPVTIQGSRTGLAGAAVPPGGHILNLSRMNRVLGMEQAGDRFLLRVQPGLILSQLRKGLEERSFSTQGWSPEERQVYTRFCRAPEQFFPTDPTETSASLGGMAACNASGARSFRYGAARNHIRGLRMVLADGDVLALSRGQFTAQGRKLRLTTLGGRRLEMLLPTYRMPETKNASGYYAADDMDAVDFLVGSDGTLGAITELTLELLPLPPVIWGVSCFFAREEQAVAFVRKAREHVAFLAALEYFDRGALDILRREKEQSTAFAGLPRLPEPEKAGACVYAEFHCEAEDEALEALYHLGRVLEEAGGSEEETWVARTPLDREQLQFFRHAVPESVNRWIDERRRTEPSLTKLAADMSVPDDCLEQVVALYREGLARYGLESAIWGHIGNNHLHVNILPRNREDYQKGKELYRQWAGQITRMGGAVSAEHGVGKLKAEYLEVMYGPAHIREMIRAKEAFDPDFLLGRGNLFPPPEVKGEQPEVKGEPLEMPGGKPEAKANAQESEANAPAACSRGDTADR